MMRTRLPGLFLGMALVAAACSSDSSTTVATVNGEAIDASQVIALRDSFTEDVNIASEDFRFDLTPLIHIEAQIQAAAEDWGIEIATEDQIDEMIANPTEQQAAVFEQVESSDDRNAATVRVVAAQLIVRDEVSKQLLRDEAVVKDYWETNRYNLIEVCARHILVGTEEEAIGAKTIVDSGEDFGAVASELSLDTGSGAQGGQLPCSPAGAYVPEFAEATATAPVGEVSAPFETQFGWHIVLVDERTGPTSLEELLADPAGVPVEAASDAYSAWLALVILDADIVVVSQIGTWDPANNGSILPPP